MKLKRLTSFLTHSDSYLRNLAKELIEIFGDLEENMKWNEIHFIKYPYAVYIKRDVNFFEFVIVKDAIKVIHRGVYQVEDYKGIILDLKEKLNL